jgi:hypothetical protein
VDLADEADARAADDDLGGASGEEGEVDGFNVLGMYS